MNPSLIRWAMVFGLTAHSIAHLPGLLVAWRWMSSPEIPYHTALLSGRVEVGDGGMRAMGLLWLGAGLGFAGSALLLASRSPLARGAITTAVVVSLALCVLEWPFARVGVMVNAVVAVLLGISALL